MAAAGLPLVLGATLLLRPTPAPRPEGLYKEALTLLRNGDYPGAVSKAHAGWQNRPPSRPPSDWSWRFRLLEAESLIDGGKAKAGLELLNAAPGTSPEFEIRRRVLQAGTSGFKAAESLLGEARQLAQSHSRPDLEPEIDQMEARFLNDRKALIRAGDLWERARHSAQATGDVYHVAASLNGLGMTLFLRARCDEAIPRFEHARELWRAVGAGYKVARADINIAMCGAELGDFDNANKYREEALGLIRPSKLLADLFGEAGAAYFLQAEPRKAIQYYHQALALARQFSSHEDAARWASNLSQALVETGDWDGAEQALQEAIHLGPEPRSLIYIDLTAGRIAAGRNRLPEARAILERVIASAGDNAGVTWDAYHAIANTWSASGDPERTNRNFDAAIGVIEQHQSDLRRKENKITFLARLIRFYQDYVDALMAQNQPVKALAVADGSRARVLSQRFGRGPQSAAPRQEAEFQSAARQSGSVWLSYWLAPNGSFLWVTTPKEIRVFRLEASSAEIASLVKEYRGFVESMRDPLQLENQAGRRLYETLIAPAVPMIPPDTPVIVVPDGPLHQLSFETLPVYGGPHPHYWIEDAAVSIAPSFGVFRGERQRPGAARKSLLIGDALSPGPGFPRLEFAAGEIATVGKHVSPGVTTITGEAAKPESWKRAGPGSFDIIHFAAHAEASRQSPLNSAIILSPGSGFRLYASDIIDVPLHADLVTLSACRSSGARSYAGEGLVGLTWAFLQAGSRHVVAGLWDVADESTSQLMDRFYAGIAKGTEPAKALRSAQLEILHSQYSKPYYWGPFQCYRR
jgi:CHAT domain-containing protein/Tfp pilus assembly protein PilF